MITVTAFITIEDDIYIAVVPSLDYIQAVEDNKRDVITAITEVCSEYSKDVIPNYRADDSYSGDWKIKIKVRIN